MLRFHRTFFTDFLTVGFDECVQLGVEAISFISLMLCLRCISIPYHGDISVISLPSQSAALSLHSLQYCGGVYVCACVLCVKNRFLYVPERCAIMVTHRCGVVCVCERERKKKSEGKG